MSDIFQEYLNKAQELSKEHKTGFECEYCQSVRAIEDHHCSKCGVSLPRIWGIVYGIPVFYLNDWLELQIHS